MRTIRFGVIGLGLMGREFASVVARWPHLTDMTARPQIVAICSARLAQETTRWYRSMCPTIEQVTRDFRQVLANPDVDAVYIAVPHDLHETLYIAAVEAGKHLLGEKPFGIDQMANARINDAIAKSPDLLVRCASEFPFVPAVQELCRRVEQGDIGRVLEVEAGLLHSSDLDPDKPINWKRRTATNGQYGCMGDLGAHICHVPFRAGWRPENVRAVLSQVVTERPDGHGRLVPCETWDNATLLCEAVDGENIFPMTLKTARIAPGETNTWYLNVYGTRTSCRFSTKSINVLQVLEYSGGEQRWSTLDIGHRVTYTSITGGIFEFGFSDAMMQMWAAFISELAETPAPGRFATCMTPQETALSHRLFTAALESHEKKTVVEVSK